MIDFLTYHIESSKVRDIDPANDCLLYISDRFELSLEQRYWLAFLYSTCYCAPTVYYLYNEFPDFENVNVGRLQRWWDNNKHKTIFQTDRLKIKTMNKFVETFVSYREFIGSGTQQERFLALAGASPVESYLKAYKAVEGVRNVGRFTLFIYLEMLNVLTDFKCVPDRLDWRHADNCRTGLCYALDIPEENPDFKLLDGTMDRYIEFLTERGVEHNNIFNVETTLCAYKKYKHGKRYIGYYIDRQEKEIEKIKGLVPTGVAWRVLDEFREETYLPQFIKQPTYDLFSNGSLRNGQNLGYDPIDKALRY